MVSPQLSFSVKTMIRTLFASAFVLASASAQAQTPPSEPVDPQTPELSSEPGSVVVLRGLDKVTARTRDFEAPIGEAVQFGALELTVQYCRKRPPEEPPEVYAFVEVDDRRTDGFGLEDEGEQIFSGWMFASNPALNALEHPVYDVWVIDCRS